MYQISIGDLILFKSPDKNIYRYGDSIHALARHQNTVLKVMMVTGHKVYVDVGLGTSNDPYYVRIYPQEYELYYAF